MIQSISLHFDSALHKNPNLVSICNWYETVVLVVCQLSFEMSSRTIKRRKSKKRQKEKIIRYDMIRCEHCDGRPFILLSSIVKHMRKKHPKNSEEDKNKWDNVLKLKNKSEIVKKDACTNTDQNNTSTPKISHAELTIETDEDGFGELVVSLF